METTIVRDNTTCLLQGIRLLSQIDQSLYTLASPPCFKSRIGGHFRHNIDHYFSFLSGYVNGKVDYDDRERDSLIENDPVLAKEMMFNIIEGLEGIKANELGRFLQVKMDSGNGNEKEPWSRSTIRRELQFLLSHTIHHYALIAIICHLQGVEPSSDFGVAPSTLKYQQLSCVL